MKQKNSAELKDECPWNDILAARLSLKLTWELTLLRDPNLWGRGLLPNIPLSLPAFQASGRTADPQVIFHNSKPE